MIKSLEYDQYEILKNIRDLYLNGEQFDCDCTYGNGSFYKGADSEPKLKFDITPLFNDVEQASSDDLGLRDQSLRSLIFDPPFITYVKQGRDHADGKCVMSSRFGGYYSYNDLKDHYIGTIREALRVLKKKGVFVVKCQDIIHNHSMHCTHNMVINECESIGFKLEDLFVLGAKSRMPSRGKQKHARIFHSYFLVFRKK